MYTTRKVNIGNVTIGGGSPIAIQSMTNTDTRDIKATVNQINELENAGCDIARVAVKYPEAAHAIAEIKKGIKIPLVADVHFDYTLAIESIKAGADKLRINPGNIGDSGRVKNVLNTAKEYGVPIRVGVNGGSLEKDLLEKYGAATADALVESALRHIAVLEENNFYDTVISVKTSGVPLTYEAYVKLAEACSYPLHVGVTEAGTVNGGKIKSAVGIGALLLRGIGDTIRVSLTGTPAEEVRCAAEILKAAEKLNDGVNFVSCPTCGRTEIDLITLAVKAEEYCLKVKKNIKVAVMGCVVNGPGEARDADIGIAAGKGSGALFKKGKVIKTLPEAELLNALIREIEEF
ncbi:MAG: flavodoxin-dependent (E)-4-hydroxy-3-methylbut-2-enyl-diphosphate synthase [Clostridiales bacterium]|jgi:(E)-4-hydroxy-3-methylbut-2-enyl-diphosphate synthase|nr:flavodoxin-dependent (E)-4-hydroxy-3-methylbut-2-enyl-diphosphate synthase [Clostridiales bacterium]